MREKTFEIDSITWNDLSLDEIYARLNSCVTTAGEEFLYDKLKNPYAYDCDEFKSQRHVFKDVKDADGLEDLRSTLNKIGKLKAYRFYETLEEFKTEKNESNVSHFIIDALVIISFAMIFIYPGPGIVLFFGAVAYSVSDYFKNKNIISGKLLVFNYLIKIIKSFSKIKCTDKSNSELIKVLNREIELCGEFKPFIRGTFLISEGARTTSNPLSILFDYVRMIFHVDIIKYNSMIEFLKNHINEASEIYRIAGELDTAIVFRDIESNSRINTSKICEPEFISTACSYEFENAYHPMLNNPVYNTISSNKNVLITGCNASGKSTFLKTVALTTLFAQSFGITFADSYKAPFYKIYSSMALKDDLNNGESYFMSEIKSLKRIVDEREKNDLNSNILCVIDEVLRGTNTVERIASSVEILKSLNGENIVCFAATHDLELTELLADSYDNYHFTEEVCDNDVKFNYKLMKGAATSRNAIRLLSVMGYSDDIIDRATRRANDYVENGVWS